MIKRFKRGEMKMARVEAFSDGVFAIIVTLLVLDLKIPQIHDPDNVKELARGILAVLPNFLGWMVSFIIVCKFWLNHHYILSMARHADYAMIWINSLFLMGQSFIPFPTALMGAYPGNPLTSCLFGCVMAFNTVLFIALQAYIYRNLLKPGMEDKVFSYMNPKAFVGPVAYLVAASVAWFSPYAAFAMYFVTPLFFIVPPAPRKL